MKPVVCAITFDQVIKGLRRLTWQIQAMKDALSCDKLRGAANKLRSGDLRMGQPNKAHTLLSSTE